MYSSFFSSAVCHHQPLFPAACLIPQSPPPRPAPQSGRFLYAPPQGPPHVTIREHTSQMLVCIVLAFLQYAIPPEWKTRGLYTFCFAHISISIQSLSVWDGFICLSVEGVTCGMCMRHMFDCVFNCKISDRYHRLWNYLARHKFRSQAYFSDLFWCFFLIPDKRDKGIYIPLSMCLWLSIYFLLCGWWLELLTPTIIEVFHSFQYHSGSNRWKSTRLGLHVMELLLAWGACVMRVPPNAHTLRCAGVTTKETGSERWQACPQVSARSPLQQPGPDRALSYLPGKLSHIF